MIPPGRVHISPWLVITSSPRRWRVQLGVVLGQRAHFHTPSGGVAEVDQALLETSISSALPLLITSRRTGAPPALTSASLNSGIVSTRCPPTLTITSPGRSPARAPGPPGRVVRMRRPLSAPSKYSAK